MKCTSKVVKTMGLSGGDIIEIVICNESFYIKKSINLLRNLYSEIERCNHFWLHLLLYELCNNTQNSDCRKTATPDSCTDNIQIRGVTVAVNFPVFCNLINSVRRKKHQYTNTDKQDTQNTKHSISLTSYFLISSIPLGKYPNPWTACTPMQTAHTPLRPSNAGVP